MYVTLQTSTCFKHQHAHLQEENCIITSSGIVTLCKRLYSTPDENRLQTAELSAVIRCTVQPFTESDDTRCCDTTICPPEDGHVDA